MARKRSTERSFEDDEEEVANNARPSKVRRNGKKQVDDEEDEDMDYEAELVDMQRRKRNAQLAEEEEEEEDKVLANAEEDGEAEEEEDGEEDEDMKSPSAEKSRKRKKAATKKTPGSGSNGKQRKRSLDQKPKPGPGEEEDEDVAEISDAENAEPWDPNADDGYDNDPTIGPFGKTAGKVKSITVVNFLCHDNLTIEMGPRVNIINGQNGSGKSAIVSGLQVCLGARTNSTSRGQSATKLIKHSRDFASVTVVLLNRGVDAYRPRDFGPLIRVTRVITRGGGSTYKLHNHLTGRVLRSKKDMLLRICHRFNIQVDNLVCVLTQEVSKRFLGSSAPQEKYKYFLEGTQLSAMHADYIKTLADLAIIQGNAASKETAVLQSERKFREAQRRYEASRSLLELEEKILKLQGELASTKYQVASEDAANSENALTKLEAELQELVVQHDAKKQALADVQRAAAEHTNTNENAQQELQRIAHDMRTLDQDVRQRENQVRSFTAQERTLTEEYETSSSRLLNLERDLAEAKTRASTMQDTRTREIEERKQSLQRQLTAVNEEADAVRLRREEVRRRQGEIGDQVRSVDTALGAIASRRREIEREKAQLRGQADNRLRAFHKDMPEKCKQVDKELHKFKKPPIGPISYFLKPEAPWADLIQASLGKLNHAWIVSCWDDAQLLRVMVGSFPKIIVQEYAPSTYPFVQYPPHISSLLSLCNVRDSAFESHPIRYRVQDVPSYKATLMNALADQRHLERSLAVRGYEEAKRIYFDGKSTLPRGTVDAYALEQDRVHKLFFRGEAQGVTDALDGNFPSLFGARDVAAEIVRLDDELRSLREQEPQHLERKNELDALRRQLDTEFTTLQREENTVRQRTRPIVTDINRCDRELEELTNMADHSGLEDQVANERTICERARTRLNEIVEQKRAAQSSVDDGPRRQREALSARMQALQSSTQEAVRMLERFATQTNAARREVATVAESVASHRQRVDTLKAELAQKKALVTTLEVQVNDFGGFYVADPPREERVVNRELQNAERQKRSAQLQLNAPSAESVMREYLAAQHRYDEDRTALDMYMQTLESLRTSVSARQRKWYQLRESFSSTLSMNFNNHLGRREHAGSLRLDHDRETMEVVVHLDGRQHQPGSSSSAAAGGGDTAGLSGGEKSFTQLCLLLAMWSSCEAPFHAADEFDVFMDNVYRKVGIDMLLDAARNVFPSRQFILVTPLDVTQIKPDPIIKKHFLKPPRQDGQASMLDFAQPVAQQE